MVQDEQGQPIEGVEVSPRFKLDMRPERTRPLGSGAVVRTDAEGRWIYASFPADLDQVEILLQHPHYTVLRTTEPISKFAVAPGQSLRGVLTMRHNVSIIGEVLDAEGRPIAGAVVRYHDPADYGVDMHTAKAKTDSSGDYCVNVPDGDYIVGALNFTGTSTAASEWWHTSGTKYSQIDAEKVTVASSPRKSEP